MIGFVGVTDRAAASRRRGGLWAVFTALLLSGALALWAPPPLPADGLAVLTNAGAPWGSATLPDPQARTGETPAAAALPSPQGKPSSSPWPKADAAGLAAAFPPRPDACRVPARCPAPAAALTPPGRLAYDSNGPPLLTR